MKAKQRAKWWIVSTHVLTSGFAMPFIASIIGSLLDGLLGLHGGVVGLAFSFGVLAIGYIGGTYYSLSYLRKSATSSDWEGCTVSAIVTFTVFAALGFAVKVMLALVFKSIPAVLALIVYYGIIIAAFSVITSNGFRMMQNQQQSPKNV